MKPRTFTQRWNITALKRIKKKYKEGYLRINSRFLCHSSQEFADLWSAYKSEIKALALDFNSDKNGVSSSSSNVLFCWSSDTEDNRLNFLNHEITRLTALRKANLG